MYKQAKLFGTVTQFPENKKDTMSENNAANSLTKRFQYRAGQVNSMLKTMQEQKYKLFQTTPMTF